MRGDLTPGLAQKIVGALDSGMTVAAAARELGVERNTIYAHAKSVRTVHDALERCRARRGH